MPLACIYSLTEPMRVVTFEERETLVATGKWFRHPNCKSTEELSHEKPIRQRTRKRRDDGQQTPESLASGT